MSASFLPYFSTLHCESGGAQKEKTTQSLILKLHLRLYFQCLFHCQCCKISHIHRQCAVSEVQLKRLGVYRLSEPFNSATVPKKVGVNSLVDASQPRCFFQHFVGVLPVEGEETLVGYQPFLVGEGENA